MAFRIQSSSAGIGAASSDFNGDGISDILWGHDGDRRLAVWQVDDFKIVQGGTIGTIGTAWDIEGIGKFNPDPRDDIVWQNEGNGPNGGTITAWLMDGVGTPTQRADRRDRPGVGDSGYR